MSLSCSCGDDGEYSWWFFAPTDYTTLTTRRRRRCCSCKALIDKGSVCAKFERRREAQHDIEISIYGEGPEIPMADWWMCERCADLYFSLDELGYCVNPEESMLELVKEYSEMKDDERKAA